MVEGNHSPDDEQHEPIENPSNSTDALMPEEAAEVAPEPAIAASASDASPSEPVDPRREAEERLKRGLELPVSVEVVNALREAARERASQTTSGPDVTASASPGDAASGAPVEIRIVVEFRGLASDEAAKTAATAADSETNAHPVPDRPQSPDFALNHRPMSTFDPLSDDKSMPKLMPVSLPITLSNARGHIQDVVHTATPEIHKTMEEICDQKINEFKRWLFIQDRRIFRE